jgi:hypothetical protein
MTTVVVKKVKTDVDAVTERTILQENGYTITYESATETTYIDASKHDGDFSEFEGGYIIIAKK